jgi:HEAT repeat protein
MSSAETLAACLFGIDAVSRLPSPHSEAMAGIQSMTTTARRRLFSVLIALAAMALVVCALIGFWLWYDGYFLTGTPGRVAAILRDVKREESRTSNPNFITRLSYSLPSPLDDLIDGIFPNNSVGEYEFTQKLAALGTNAVPPLLTAIESDRSVAARRVAANALARMHATQATPLLAKILRNDADNEVRVAMADALRDMRDTNAVPALLETLEKDAESSVRSTCAQALGDMRVYAAAPAILVALEKESDDLYKAHMVTALGELAYAPAAPTLIKLLAPASQSSTPTRGSAFQSSYSLNELREEVAKALGVIGGEAAVDALVNQLTQEKDASVGRAICSALGKMGGPKAVTALRAQFDVQGDFRAAAVLALGAIGDASQVKDLVALFEDPDEEVRAAAVTAVGIIGDPSALENLRALMPRERADEVLGAGCTTLALIGDASDQALVVEAIRRMSEHKVDAIWAVAYLGDTNATSLLAEVLKSSNDTSARFAAAYGLALVGGADAKRALHENVSDKDEYTRHGKACALLMLGDDAGLKTVKSSLQCENDWQRFGAVLAVDQSGLKSTPELLALAGQNPEEGVRLFVDGAKARQASAALISLLGTGDKSYRNYAARALVFYYDTNALPVLRAACKDSDEEVREAARLTLRRMEREQQLRNSP